MPQTIVESTTLLHVISWNTKIERLEHGIGQPSNLVLGVIARINIQGECLSNNEQGQIMEGQGEGERQIPDTASVVDIIDDSTDFNYLDQKKYIRMIERNMKEEIKRRDLRNEKEKHGKGIPTNYNLDGNMEGLLNFLYWKCDCCQNSFQRIRPAPYKKDLFVHEGQNVMVKRNNEENPRKVPLCNRCITLYHLKGWLVTK